MADLVDKAISPSTGKIYHTAIRYGVTQACLDAVAKSQSKLMAQVVANEYGTEVSKKIIPIFSQSGDDRYLNADKMIMKCADVLPHALFNHVETKVGLKAKRLKSMLAGYATVFSNYVHANATTLSSILMFMEHSASSSITILRLSLNTLARWQK